MYAVQFLDLAIIAICLSSSRELQCLLQKYDLAFSTFILELKLLTRPGVDLVKPKKLYWAYF